MVKAKQIIDNALEYSRTKHPDFVDTLGDALLIAQEELGEAIRAYNTRKELEKQGKEASKGEVYLELAQCAAVIIRTLEGEYVPAIRENLGK